MRKPLKQLIIIMLLWVIVTAFTFSPAVTARASEQKLVRVGWFDSTLCYWDQFGRRCGIDYEYQHRISAYTGWTYEYVEDSWPNLLEMLMNGEIDLLSDVSYKPEREEFLAYPDLPMGTESYYIFIDGENREITAENLASFDGKRIGVNKGSVQEGFLRDWAKKNGITVEVVPLTYGEDESMNMVMRGQLDGYASVYTYSSEYGAIPVCRIGSSDYYYAVNKNRPDLLAELNMALAGIRDEDPYFNERLSEVQLYGTRTNAFLLPNQEDWLREHGAIRIGYLEDYLPYCATDTNGKLTGALKDFLAHTVNNLGTSEIRFETKSYATTRSALEGLKAGEVDCVFPVHLNDYDADQQGVRLTNPAMKTGMNTVLRESEEVSLSRTSELAVALPDGNPNLETFVKEQYPSCRIRVFPDDNACYQAVVSSLADCALVSNYRIPATEEFFSKNKLFSVPTGEHIPYSFAVNLADRDLYFLLNKAVVLTESGDMDSALASYMRSTQKVSFMQFLEDHWLTVLAIIIVVFAIIVVLLLQRLKAQRKAHEQEQMLQEAAEVAELKQTITSLLDNMPGMSVTKDAKTGVYLACNQAFADYALKKDPSEVIGHTDAELFDELTAKQLAEEDRVALSMEEPYIFFEDSLDASGNRRQIKKTKLKYTDATGRLCVLGMSQDITDSFRIRRENATTREAYEKARGNSAIFAHIAQALARGYARLYYIDLNTEQFIEYRVDDAAGSLTEVRRGWHFFEECQEEVEAEVFEEDREAVKKAMDRKALVAALDQNNSFMMTYRLNGEQGPNYVSLKVTRMQDDDRFIVLGLTDIDEQVRQRSMATRAQEEQIAYNRLVGLAGDYLCVYIVDPETGNYREFTSNAGYQDFAEAQEETDFFGITREAARRFNYPEDLNLFLSVFNRENVLADIKNHGMFTLTYRLMVANRPRYVQMKAVMLEEKEGPRLIVGVNDIDSQIRQEESYVRHLSRARMEASVDALTGVKNRHAYLIAEERLNEQIAADPARQFAIVILDVNDLKKVNDRDGHQAGDQYLKDACKTICNTFKHSPVFRVGGDEFAVIAQGEDYERLDELTGQMDVQNQRALSEGGIVIACGMARRENNDTASTVFEKADQHMYENKSKLKNMG